MVKSTSRRGRPVAIHHPKIGDPVVGLFRLADGRWRASGPEKYTFTEHDEGLAIAHFREWQQRNRQSNLGTVRVHESFGPAFRDVLKRAVDAGGSIKAEFAPAHSSGGNYVVTDETLNPSQWAWLRRQIIDRPVWVAERVGIEQIGYLHNIKAPVALPSLATLAEIWDQHFTSSDEQKRKCPKAFKHFCKVSGIDRIEAITPEKVVKFRDHVYAKGMTGKTQSNIFTRVRRYLAFFRDRAMAIDEINKALDYLALLTPDETTITLDPKPIEPADWTKLLAAAESDNKAMILVMLNCAMYLQEAVRVRWEDIRDGCLITHRKKTGRCIRVATLWPETIEALADVKRNGQFVFNNYTGAPLGVKGAEMRFRELRDGAGLKVTSSQLRDGAYTYAAAAGISANLCQLLVGHRSGIGDHYILRQPHMVAPACAAIHAAYFPTARANGKTKAKRSKAAAA